MSFSRPLALVALAAVPLFILLWLRLDRRRRTGAAAFANLALLPNLVDALPGRRRLIPQIAFLLAVAALIVGMARPHAHISVPRHDATVVLAIDISRSMSATDVRPTRLLAAEAAANAFVDHVPSTYNIAVVAFGSQAFVAVPPTLDRALVHTTIGDLVVGQGTALGDAISVAAHLGSRIHSADGTVPPESVLLISDGTQEGGRISPTAAVRQARSLGVPVSTVLIGTPSGIVDQKLVGGYTEEIHVPPSPGTLALVAKDTGGDYFQARTPRELASVYRHLATRLGHKTENREITDTFAVGAIVLLLAAGGLSLLWFKRVIP